jgi:hypothetical protein
LRALLQSSRLPYSRIGLPGKRGRVLIKVSDLDKLLDDTRRLRLPFAVARASGDNVADETREPPPWLRSATAF